MKNFTTTPPPRHSEVLPVVLRMKEVYRFWLALHRNFPKTERYGLGRRIDQLFLEILESSFTASYLPLEQKIIYLGENNI